MVTVAIVTLATLSVMNKRDLVLRNIPFILSTTLKTLLASLKQEITKLKKLDFKMFFK